MIPIVVRSTEEMLKIVPNDLREASYALGVPKWRTIVKVVLPTAIAGIITGVMLAIARVIGETAPLLVIDRRDRLDQHQPVRRADENLPVYIYSEYRPAGRAKQASYDRAWAAALTLIAIVMVLNLVARLVYRRYKTEIRSPWWKGTERWSSDRTRARSRGAGAGATEASPALRRTRDPMAKQHRRRIRT